MNHTARRPQPPISIKLVIIGTCRPTLLRRSARKRELDAPFLSPARTHPSSVLAGDGGVGKSSITTALLRREFVEDWDPTIEDSYSTNLCIEGQDYNVEIVDTAGQEEYRGK